MFLKVSDDVISALGVVITIPGAMNRSWFLPYCCDGDAGKMAV